MCPDFLDHAKRYLEKLKDSLWKGDIKQIGRLVKKGIKGVDLKTFTPFKYFEKNKQGLIISFLKNN